MCRIQCEVISLQCAVSSLQCAVTQRQLSPVHLGRCGPSEYNSNWNVCTQSPVHYTVHCTRHCTLYRVQCTVHMTHYTPQKMFTQATVLYTVHQDNTGHCPGQQISPLVQCPQSCKMFKCAHCGKYCCFINWAGAHVTSASSSPCLSSLPPRFDQSRKNLIFLLDEDISFPNTGSFSNLSGPGNAYIDKKVGPGAQGQKVQSISTACTLEVYSSVHTV